MDTAILTGTSSDGARWTLYSQDTPPVPGVLLRVYTAAGVHCWSTGTTSTPPPHAQLIDGAAFTGEQDEPSTWLMKLHPDVRAVLVRFSDGTEQDLRVVDDPHHPGVRWAVLAHPLHLHVHRIQLRDAAGAALPDVVP